MAAHGERSAGAVPGSQGEITPEEIREALADLVKEGELTQAQADEVVRRVFEDDGDNSPAFNINEIVESAMKPTDIGYAIQCLKGGFKVRRIGWRNKDKFLWFKPPAGVKAEWCKDPMLRKLVEANGGEMPALGTICMYLSVDGKPTFLTGWSPTPCDLLADDWECLPEEGVPADDGAQEG